MNLTARITKPHRKSHNQQSTTTTEQPIKDVPTTTETPVATTEEPTRDVPVTTDATVTTTEELSTELRTREEDKKFKVVCNFQSEAWYRPEDRKYTPEHIDEKLCTHIIYKTAVLDPVTLTIKVNDSLVDEENGYYKKVTDFKKKGISVLISIGGWENSGGDKYSRLVRNATARANFVTSVVAFMEQHNFDGLEMNWQYPACTQNDCKAGNSEEKYRFTDLMRELSEAFKPRGLLLTAFVSPQADIIPKAYDIPELSK